MRRSATLRKDRSVFFNASPTPYDLRFELLGFPVRIHPGFWVLSLLLGRSESPRLLVAWVVAVLFSILVHELGHAFVQRAFGGRPKIVLYAFGGYAAAEGVDRAWWKNVVVSLAGPCAGFALFGVVFAIALRFGAPPNEQARKLVESLLTINLLWSVFNLAPIWPLDGGRVSREVLTRFLRPSTGIVASLWLSIACSGLLAAYLWWITRSPWNLMLCGMLGYQSYQTLSNYQRSRGAR